MKKLFIAVIFGICLILTNNIEAQQKSDIKIDTHEVTKGNIRELSPRESPTPHNFSLKNPPFKTKGPATPTNPRIIIQSDDDKKKEE